MTSYLSYFIAIMVLALMFVAHAETLVDKEVLEFLAESADDVEIHPIVSISQEKNEIVDAFHKCEASTSTLKDERTCKTDVLASVRSDTYMNAFKKAGLKPEEVSLEERNKFWATIPKDSPTYIFELMSRKNRYRHNLLFRKCWIRCQDQAVDSEDRFDANDVDDEDKCRQTCVVQFQSRVAKEAERDIIGIKKLAEDEKSVADKQGGNISLVDQGEKRCGRRFIASRIRFVC